MGCALEVDLEMVPVAADRKQLIRQSTWTWVVTLDFAQRDMLREKPNAMKFFLEFVRLVFKVSILEFGVVLGGEYFDIHAISPSTLHNAPEHEFPAKSRGRYRYPMRWLCYRDI